MGMGFPSPPRLLLYSLGMSLSTQVLTSVLRALEYYSLSCSKKRSVRTGSRFRDSAHEKEEELMAPGP